MDIFSNSSILKQCIVYIDGTEIISEDIVTFEIKQNIDTFGIYGTLKMKDTFDINNSGLFDLNGNNELEIFMADAFESESKRTFKITSTNVGINERGFKVYEFSFVDVITFALQNTFISKSFNASPVDAFSQYMTFMGIDEMLTNDDLTTDIVDTAEVVNFVVPQNVSVLDYFLSVFKLENIRMWQDRYGIYVKEVIPSAMPISLDGSGGEITYTDNVSGNEYAYKVFERSEVKNDVVNTNDMYPIKKTFRFDGNKEILNITTNLIDEVDNFKLNTLDSSYLQLTDGEKLSFQSNVTIGNQTFDLFNAYMKNNKMNIAIIGDLKRSNICYIVKTSFKGNINSVESSANGDVLTGGKYFVNAVSDRIIGDKIIQRLSLCRIDATEVL